MYFADNYERIFVVISVLDLEAANPYFAKAEIIGGILPNLVAFVFSCSYWVFLFTGPLFNKGKKDV